MSCKTPYRRAKDGRGQLAPGSCFHFLQVHQIQFYLCRVMLSRVVTGTRTGLRMMALQPDGLKHSAGGNKINHVHAGAVSAWSRLAGKLDNGAQQETALAPCNMMLGPQHWPWLLYCA